MQLHNLEPNNMHNQRNRKKERARINWSSINVTGISGTMITMPDIAYVSIFMDNDLTHITEEHVQDILS